MTNPSQPYTLPSLTSPMHKPKLVKEYGCPTHGGKSKRIIPERKTRKPNKMYSECAYEPFLAYSATRYFLATGKRERTHHT